MTRHISNSLRDGVAQDLDRLKQATGLTEYEVLNQVVAFAGKNMPAFLQFTGSGTVVSRMNANQQTAQTAVSMKDLRSAVDPEAGSGIRLDMGDSGRIALTAEELKNIKTRPKAQKDQSQLR